MAAGLYTFVVWNISVYGGDIEGNEDCVRISLLFINQSEKRDPGNEVGEITITSYYDAMVIFYPILVPFISEDKGATQTNTQYAKETARGCCIHREEVWVGEGGLTSQ